MMYLGGKARLAKKLLPMMLPHRLAKQWWVEPFVGGGGMFDKVVGPKLGADIDRYAIEALIAVRDRAHDLPPNNQYFTEEDYRKLRIDDSCWFKGFAGFAYSFGGKWMGGWSRNNDGRDYVAVAYRNAQAQAPKLAGSILLVTDYRSLSLPPCSLIYCDPPYRGTTGYTHKFDHDVFWEWCRSRAEEGHTLFVSEYAAPTDFVSIWNAEYRADMRRGGSRTVETEHLFVWGKTWKDAK